MLKRHTDLDIKPPSDVRTRERGGHRTLTPVSFLILDVNGRRREHFRQLLSHIRVVDGLFERRSTGMLSAG